MDRRPLLVAAAGLATLVAALVTLAVPASGAVQLQVVRLAAVPPPSLPGGTTTVPTSYAVRPYVLHVPAGLLAPAPLVIALHGHSQEPANIRAYSLLERLSDEQGFVVAFPSGGAGSWNAGTCCFPSSDENTDDVAYLDEVLASIARRVPVDPDRVAIVGGSNGGMMALRYACERPLVIASVAIVSGVNVSACTPTAPIAVLALHGARDNVVPLRGGPNAALRTAFPDVSRSLDPFRRAGGDVQLRIVASAGHTWMTRDAHGVDATRALWDFIRDHPRLGAPRQVNDG